MSKTQVLTLYYHRINVLEHDCNLLCVSPDRFRQQMLYLKDNYQITRFEEDWSNLNENAVAVTFDDGYLDNLTYAVPILEELEIPATIFVSTGTMNQKRELWWDELERLLLVGGSFPESFCLTDDEFGCEWETSTIELRKNCYQALHYLMKNHSLPAKRENWMRQLWEWRGLEPVARKEYLTLSEQNVRSLAQSKLISVGAHTISHPALAKLPAALQETEIVTSISRISELTGREITIFSYPFGGCPDDYNEKTMEICRRAGIRKAASTENALWDGDTDPYRIPRKVVRDWRLFEFADKMKEYWKD